MKKKNIGIIGHGKWAKTIIPTLQKYFKIKFILNSKINYKLICLDQLDWVFVLSNNDSHFEIVKYLLNKKKNIFCEKPLTSNFKEVKYLYSLANKKNCKLYVDDVEYFKKKKIFLEKKNIIKRLKKAQKSSVSLLFRFAYHDFYLLKDFINLKQIKKIRIKENSTNLKISFLSGENFFSFIYSINSNKKLHKINKADFLNIKRKPLNLMFEGMIKNKLNFDKNKERTLFSSKLISILKKKYR